jgi:large subunit ribosomal protein L3
MNMHPGLIGKKLGNTQIFEDDGNVTRVTAIEVGPCTVLGKRTTEKDGYTALILGMGERTAKHVNKPEAGHYAKIAQKAAEVVRELRLPEAELAKFEVGAVLKPSDIFSAGQFVDVSAQTRGRGFTGVMARWNFRGSATKTHGTHEYQRHGGAIGTNMTPGRTLPNLKMPGHYGDERVTVQNQKIARVMDEECMVLVAGAVPGPKGGIVTVRGAIKKRGGKVASA